MSSLAKLALTPLNLLLNLAYARPWLSMAISATAGLLAQLTSHPMWMVLFVCFMSYMLMWLDEAQHPLPATPAAEE